MKFMQPNENGSRNLWIEFFEGDWHKGFGEVKKQWGGGRKARGCGVIKIEVKWMKQKRKD